MTHVEDNQKKAKKIGAVALTLVLLSAGGCGAYLGLNKDKESLEDETVSLNEEEEKETLHVDEVEIKRGEDGTLYVEKKKNKVGHLEDVVVEEANEKNYTQGRGGFAHLDDVVKREATEVAVGERNLGKLESVAVSHALEKDKGVNLIRDDKGNLAFESNVDKDKDESSLVASTNPEVVPPIKQEPVEPTEPEVKPEPKPEPEKPTEPEVKPEPKPEPEKPTEPEVKPDPKPEPEKPTEPEVKPDPKPEPEKPTEPEVKPDPKPEPEKPTEPEPKPVDKTELEKVKEKVKTLDRDKYTKESLDVLDKVMKDSDVAKTQKEVDEAVKEIEKAMNDLKTKEIAEFEKAIEDYQTNINSIKEKLNSDDYTKGSSDKVKIDLFDIEELFNELEQDKDTEGIKELSEFVKELESELVDLSQLKELIKEVDELDLEAFTDESTLKLNEAKELANSVLGNPDATKEEIEQAVESVTQAKEGLEANEEKKNDSSEIEKNQEFESQPDLKEKDNGEENN